MPDVLGLYYLIFLDLCSGSVSGSGSGIGSGEGTGCGSGLGIGSGWKDGFLSSLSKNNSPSINNSTFRIIYLADQSTANMTLVALITA
jgi:hypothetical protein